MNAAAPARTPEPPYFAVIFTSLRTEGDRGYDTVATRMAELAAQQPGYLGVESARAAKCSAPILMNSRHPHPRPFSSLRQVLALVAMVSFSTPLFAAENENPSLIAGPLEEYSDAVHNAGLRYLRRLAVLFEKADEVEVFLLTAKPPGYHHYQFDEMVSERRQFIGAENGPWIKALQQTLRSATPDSSACHFPAHGIRVWKHRPPKPDQDTRELLFEATLCWECENFVVAELRPPIRFGLAAEGLLKELCTKLLPLPEPFRK